MSFEGERSHVAFAGNDRLAAGELRDVALAARSHLAHGGRGPIRIFDDATGGIVEVDLGGTPEEIVARLPRPDDLLEAQTAASSPARGPGRPKLGVVSKEVTLLPRHWAWLAAQRGSVSATLRRLIDEARHLHEARDAVRRAQDSAYRFMSVMVGSEPSFEEAIRALYRGDADRFERESQGWPPDVRAHSRRLASEAFRQPQGEPTQDERN